MRNYRDDGRLFRVTVIQISEQDLLFFWNSRTRIALIADKEL